MSENKLDIDPQGLDWDKVGGLMPAIVQDVDTRQVLMLGYMNADALEKTYEDGRVTFFSRTKQRLWQKGETSGNALLLRSIEADCDNDTLLVLAEPKGPTCHLGTTSCFGSEKAPNVGLGVGWLAELECIIADRASGEDGESYTRSLLAKGRGAVAQKVGEEATEVVVAALDESDERLASEAADLLFHLLVLLKSRDVALADVLGCLEARHN